ncbi:unnamed protein product [Haemonchus placei]|uniref:Uncharacterized protein n=1 Tax=Haemonchus placei TaxID=6290 RepID=A0A0N4W496_HAEPC|nr:unnamed protein product [Haemonchus placei]
MTRRGSTTSTQATLIPGHTNRWNNLPFTLVGTTTPQLPILGSTSMENEGNIAIIKSAQRAQLMPHIAGYSISHGRPTPINVLINVITYTTAATALQRQRFHNVANRSLHHRLQTVDDPAQSQLLRNVNAAHRDYSISTGRPHLINVSASTPATIAHQGYRSHTANNHLTTPDSPHHKQHYTSTTTHRDKQVLYHGPSLFNVTTPYHPQPQLLSNLIISTSPTIALNASVSANSTSLNEVTKSDIAYYLSTTSESSAIPISDSISTPSRPLSTSTTQIGATRPFLWKLLERHRLHTVDDALSPLTTLHHQLSTASTPVKNSPDSL